MQSSEQLVSILSHPITQSILLHSVRRSTGLPLTQHTTLTATTTNGDNSSSSSSSSTQDEEVVVRQLAQLVQTLKDRNFDSALLNRLLNMEDMERGGGDSGGARHDDDDHHHINGSFRFIDNDHNDSVSTALNQHIHEMLIDQQQQQQSNANADNGAENYRKMAHIAPAAADTPTDEQQDDGDNDDHMHEYVMKQAAVQQICEAELDMLDLVMEKYVHDLETELRIPPPLSATIKKEDQTIIMDTSAAAADGGGGHPLSMTPGGSEFSMDSMYSPGGGSGIGSGGGIDNDGGDLDLLFDPEEVGSKRPEDVIDELKRKYSDAALTEHFAKKKKKNFSKEVTSYLNQWFFDHLADPYPTEDEKRQMAEDTGLSLGQINNWLGNKRMRYKRKKLQELNRKGGNQVKSGGGGGGTKKKKKKGGGKGDTDDEEDFESSS